MNSGSERPQRVTRFYGNVGYALDVIANKQITFVHMSLLNDPFDPYFFLETDFEENRHRLLKYVREHHPKDFGWFQRTVTVQGWTQTMNALKLAIVSWREGTFIFSTSGADNGLHPKDNLYMWGHYGNGHRGVAIEFDTAALTKSALKQHKEINPSSEVDDLWVKIEYCTSLAPITAADFFAFTKQDHEFNSGKIAVKTPTNLEAYYGRTLRFKSDVWHAEREWRVMWRNNDTRMKIYRFPIDSDAISAVFLGLNLSTGARTDFIFEVGQKFPQAAVFQAKKQHGNFALEFEQLAGPEAK